MDITPVVIAPYSSRKLVLPYKIVTLPPKIFQLYRYVPEAFADKIFLFIYYIIQRKHNFDVWHITMGYPAGVSFVKFSSKFNIPYFIRCAGSDIQVSNVGNYGDRRNKKIDKIVRRKLTCSPFMVSISESVRKEYIKLLINEEKIIHIPNGVDLSSFNSSPSNKHDIYNKYNIPHDFKLFLSVGRNHDKKNFSLLFNVARDLLSKGFTTFKFIIVGDNVESLNTYITDDVTSNFILLKPFCLDYNNDVPQIPHRDLIAIYKASDLFVFPSFIETFGIVLVEAMASGLPIVTSDVEGCRDLVEHGKNGFLCNPDSSIDFARRILQLTLDQKFYSEISDNNILKAQNYDWCHITNMYVKLYNKLVK